MHPYRTSEEGYLHPSTAYEKVTFIFALALLLTTAQAQQRITVTPQTAKAGDTLLITYDPAAKGATLGGEDKLMTQEVVFENDRPTGALIDMQKKGSLWTALCILRHPKAQLLLFNVYGGENGDKLDETDENCPLVMLYGTDGKPVKGALLTRARLFMSGGFGKRFKLQRDDSAAMADVQEELRLYPDNWSASSLLLTLQYFKDPAGENRARIISDFEKLFASVRNDEEATLNLLAVFARFGMREKGDSISKVILTEKPKGKLAQQQRLSEIYQPSNTKNRTAMLDEFLDSFSIQGDERDQQLTGRIVPAYVQDKQFDKALAALDKVQKPSGGLFNTVAWGMIENDVQLERAVEIARKGVEASRKDLAGPPTSDVTEEQWQKWLRPSLGEVLDTYGFGLSKLGRTQEAEKAYEEAIVLTDSADADIGERLVQCYIKNEKPEKALEAAASLVSKGHSTPKMLEAYKAAYVKVKGSDAGFDKLVEKSQEKLKADAAKVALKGMIDKPAVDFTLKDLKGKKVKLSGLKGKVVVIDFWATWCGPCKASFPFLQQVYDKYKRNNSVVFLALNTWEKVEGKALLDSVKAFLKENKYTFPVLMDDQKIVEKYGVEGIPTKFIIDKRGSMRFKSVGFLDGPKMIAELTSEIDLLLKDEFYRKE